jgi:hypothetical protein
LFLVIPNATGDQPATRAVMLRDRRAEVSRCLWNAPAAKIAPDQFPGAAIMHSITTRHHRPSAQDLCRRGIRGASATRAAAAPSELDAPAVVMTRWFIMGRRARPSRASGRPPAVRVRARGADRGGRRR